MGLEELLGGSRSTDTGRGVIPSIWRGVVVEAYSDGTVSVKVPSLLGSQAVRVPCLLPPPGPGPQTAVKGDRVLLAAIEGRVDDLIVILSG